MKKIAFVSIFLVLTACAMGKANNNLPMEKFPIHTLGNFTDGNPFILYLTGDGGWNKFSKQLCNDFHRKGYSVVVFNSRNYFWKAKNPKKFVHDLEGIIEFYLKKASVKEFCVVGYSFGADVSTFVPALLSKKLKEKLHPMVLISPGLSTDFKVRLLDLLGFHERKRKYKILPELENTNVPVLCIFGEDEELEIKDYLKESEKISVQILPGGHRLNFATENLAKLIIRTVDPVLDRGSV